METLLLSKEEFIEFVNKYQQAENNQERTFMYKNNEFLTKYAKYIVEYYSKVLKTNLL